MHFLHNPRFARPGDPGREPWPVSPWAVVRVSHHLDRWPRALDLVPAGLVRGPWTVARWPRSGRAGGRWPRYLVRA